MRNPTLPCALALSSLLFASSAAVAVAQDPGGVSAPGASVSPSAVGGATPTAANTRPVARLSVRSPVGGGPPQISVRFDEPGVDSVIARMVVLRTPGNAVAARIALGSVRTGRPISVAWPQGSRLAAGQYLVRVHAHDRYSHQLRRLAHASGKSTLLVRPPPPVVTAPPLPAPSPHGAYPVVGVHSYGELFGAPRKGYTHQGVDILAAEGTPIVSPLGGTVASTGTQSRGAGVYVVLNASDGHAYFFAHCQQGSVGVTTGQVVVTGGAICRMGHTGDATGPHLHFEEWAGGWRVDAGSIPIDPLPQLKAWAG